MRTHPEEFSLDARARAWYDQADVLAALQDEYGNDGTTGLVARGNSRNLQGGKPCDLTLRTVDATIEFVPGLEIDCTITGNRQAGMFMSARILTFDKGVNNEDLWQLTLYMYNQESISQETGNFEMETFSDSEGTQRSRLDLIQIPAFPIVNVMTHFDVQNNALVQDGSKIVPDIAFHLVFPDEIRNTRKHHFFTSVVIFHRNHGLVFRLFFFEYG